MNRVAKDRYRRAITHSGTYIARITTASLIIVCVATAWEAWRDYWQNDKITKVGGDVVIARAEISVMKQQNLESAERETQRWDALAKWNEGILDVPRVREPQPVGTAKVPAEELRRHPDDGIGTHAQHLLRYANSTPAPTPTPKVIVKTKTRYKAKPTPTPWFHFFKQTR